MAYKIIALDLDGTLTNEEKKITPKTYASLMKAQEQGVKIALVSGRSPFGIAPLAEELQLEKYEGYVLAFNGGKIIDWQTKEVLSNSFLSPEVLPYLYECSERTGFPILTYQGDEIITEHPEDKYVIEEQRITKMPVRKVDDFLRDVQHPINKCLIVGNPEPLHELELEMAEHLKGIMSVFRSAPFFIELVPGEVDKAKMLEVLLERLGIKRSELMACGDGYNDLTMIEYAGLGVAMNNAVDEVKARAQFITLSNEDDGVGYAVDRFILGE